MTMILSTLKYSLKKVHFVIMSHLHVLLQFNNKIILKKYTHSKHTKAHIKYLIVILTVVCYLIIFKVYCILYS